MMTIFSRVFSSLGYILLLTLALVFISSCRTLKPVKPTTTINDTTAKKLDFKTPKTLTKYLKENEFNFDWLSTKFSATVENDGSKNSFNVSVRAKKDSAMWISVSLLGIEGARMLITQDSVKYMDKINKKYFKGDYQYLSKLLNLEVDFDDVQALLIGNSTEFYMEDDRLKSAKDSSSYLLSTIKKRKLHKILKGDINKSYNETVQSYWLNPLTFKIQKTVIFDMPNNRTFTANYYNFKPIENAYFPFKADFYIEASKKIFVNIEYSKVVHDEALTMPFNIPEKYERIW